MKLTPEELAAHNYILLNSMPHHNLIPFVRTYLKKPTRAVAAYYGSVVASLSLLIFFCIKYHKTDGLTLGQSLNYTMTGIALSLTLIPLHEFIHVLAYKMMGATRTSYDVNLKKFYFLALADGFVANRSEFRIVALAPFVGISVVLIGLTLFTNITWTIILLSTVMTHASFCSGDFALLSYFEVNSDKEVVTYDDKQEKISFFYGRIR